MSEFLDESDFWRDIPDFDGHRVSRNGQIQNVQSGKTLQSSVNQTGVRHVHMRNTTMGRYQVVAVGVLVASAFCDGRTANENTVLHLNGNTKDVNAKNLMWATRWHAIQYHKEIHQVKPNDRMRVTDETGRIYRHVLDAAKATGALPSAISYAVDYNVALAQDEDMNFVHKVYPGGHVFKKA